MKNDGFLPLFKVWFSVTWEYKEDFYKVFFYKSS